MQYLRHTVWTALTICAFAAPAAAQTSAQVDDDQVQCPNAQYTSIQAAITAVPAGATISVCPGTYAEQLRIIRNVTIVGVPTAGKSAVIVKPTAALTFATYSGRPIRPVVFVKPAAGNLTSVNLINLTIDGSGLTFADCTDASMGVYYGNTSGQMYALAVRNITNGPGLTGCQGGLGIFVQSSTGGGVSTVNVSYSTLHDYDKNGISANEVGTTVTLKSNTITGLGDKTAAAQNGIQLGYGAKGSIEGNAVSNHAWSGCTADDCAFVATNILLYGVSNTTVKTNLLSQSQVNVAVQGYPGTGMADPSIPSNNNQLTSNLISDDLFDGISIFDGNSNQVSSNLINNSAEAGVFVDGSGANNTISGNTIDEAPCGVLTGTNPVGANTYFNTVNNLCSTSATAVKARASNGGDEAKHVQSVR